jgi:hypothetical protein
MNQVTSRQDIAVPEDDGLRLEEEGSLSSLDEMEMMISGRAYIFLSPLCNAVSISSKKTIDILGICYIRDAYFISRRYILHSYPPPTPPLQALLRARSMGVTLHSSFSLRSCALLRKIMMWRGFVSLPSHSSKKTHIKMLVP